MTVRIDVKKPFLTPEELSTVLKVNVATIHKLIKEKQLKAFRVGRQYRIPQEELDTFLSDVSTAGEQVKTIIIENKSEVKNNE